MKRRSLVRLQLIFLAALTVAVFIRLVGGGPGSSGLVVMEGNLEPEQLHHTAMTVEEPMSVEIEVTGSYLDDTRLAAFGWVFDRDRKETVWVMDAERAERARRTLAREKAVIDLQPGTYDVYFAGYGEDGEARRRGVLSSLFQRRSERWKADAKRWSLRVKAADRSQARLASLAQTTVPSSAGEKLIWRTESPRAGQEQQFIFEVARPVPINAYAVGEIRQDQADRGWIENALTGEIIWQFEDKSTSPAGGAYYNRFFDGDLYLQPGLYRAVWEPARTYSFPNWPSRPPFDPKGWGVQLSVLSSSTRDHVAPVDPWESLPRIVDLTRIGNGEQASATIEVDTASRVLLYATGEGASRRMYDYAYVVDEATRKRVWEMRASQTEHAGGARKNRRAVALLDLEPGVYGVHFVTDGSHAYDSWNERAPDHPERWGVALFAFDEANVRYVGGERGPLAAAPVMSDSESTGGEPSAPSDGGAESVAAARGSDVRVGATLVSLNRLSNNARVQAEFRLEKRADVHVYAVGEIMLSDRFDYGWIEDSSGKIVWEMTRQNTEHAGGALKNRVFDGVIPLPPGRYKVHFQTDDSHAFGNFNQDQPDDPEGWGITVREVES